MPYFYDRTGSDAEHTAKMLKEMLRQLPGFHGEASKFRQAVQQYTKAAHGLPDDDDEVQDELADPILLGKLDDLTTHLVEAEKLLGQLTKYKPPARD